MNHETPADGCSWVHPVAEVKSLLAVGPPRTSWRWRARLHGEIHGPAVVGKVLANPFDVFVGR